jgi:uncharacterized membrane protein
MEQSRWRSPVAWSAVVALALFILKTYGLLSFIGLTEDSFKELTILLFTVLTAFGLFNNPTHADKF